jgi:hypothetical protein
MTISVDDEQLVTLNELARSLPKRRNNRPVHVSTIHRWRTRGLSGGIRLEAVRIGGVWHTSREAFVRFCERLTAASAPPAPDWSPPRSRRQKNADAELRDGGW